MQFVTPTRRSWTLNYYITQCTGNSIIWGSDELETRCGRENQHPERLGPQASGWAAQENRKEMQLWPIEWGSICCSSVRSSTPSHTQSFQIKWEVYFSKNSVARLYCVVVMILHASVYLAIQHNMIWWLEPGMSFMAWFRAWIDDPRSGQRQKEYSTWEASKRKFGKIPAKKEEKGTDQQKRTEKKRKEKNKGKNCNMLDGKKKKEKKQERPTMTNKEKQKREHHRACK